MAPNLNILSAHIIGQIAQPKKKKEMNPSVPILSKGLEISLSGTFRKINHVMFLLRNVF